MKKLFIVLAVASLGFVACNNESKIEEKSADTTVVTAPQDTVVVAPVDTTAKKDTLQK
ncbi:MAG TPA: hypothetical protein VFD56_11300 [Chitinophagaceae bacterium]|nr:hypothetical protein [Chitinophagaceae bacterium]